MSAPDRLAAIRERCWSPSTLDMPTPIATARQDLAYLLAEVDRLRAEAARAHELGNRVMGLESALRPFAHFAARFDAQPLRGLADTLYAIHTGTSWEAEITLGDAWELTPRCS